MHEATLLAAGWTTGINAYLTLLLLGLAGRLDWAETPPVLQRPGVLVVVGVLFALEFVVDKVPLLDSAWDLLHTLIRPTVGTLVGVAAAGADNDFAFSGPVAGVLAGGLALAGHLTKASTRLAINTSPEPFTNVIASFAEDGLVAAMVILALWQPRVAAMLALFAAAVGLLVAIAMFTLARRGYRRVRRRWARWGGTGGHGGAAPPVDRPGVRH
ncbi:MAG: DUF4126 domain-containing protein [Acidimicrobiales bacterium]